MVDLVPESIMVGSVQAKLSVQELASVSGSLMGLAVREGCMGTANGSEGEAHLVLGMSQSKEPGSVAAPMLSLSCWLTCG